MRAKRGSEPTAVKVIKAINVFCNLVILLRRGRSLQLRDSFNGGIISTIAAQLTKNWHVTVAFSSSGYRDLALLGERFHVIEPERWNKMFSLQVSSAVTPVSLESLAREKMSQNLITYGISQSS